MTINILSKDSRVFRFTPSIDEDQKKISRIVASIKRSAFTKDCFAFVHTLEGDDGWKIFNKAKEYERMGLNLNDKTCKFRYYSNKNYKTCATYPELLVVAREVKDEDIINSSNFRTKQRFPALTYYHKKNGASIWRSSQPREGLWGSINKGDQTLIASIVKTAGNITKKFNCIDKDNAKLHIIDPRPKMNAIGNKVMGSGYENTDNYESTWIHFCDIENIHKMRESYLKLTELCSSESKLKSERWLSYLDGTDWLLHLHYIIGGMNMILSSIRSGRAVLIHCSDGWDRTSQLSALAQLVLDEYYRTIIGFEMLIEKDFVMFGHQFCKRLGHGVQGYSTEASPVFIQFLDCVHQLLIQFPTLFEFNDTFLCDIASHIYSQRFGTFLMDCERERTASSLHKRTVSLWTFLNTSKERYINPLYDPKDDYILPNSSILNLSLWEEYHLMWTPFKRTLNTPM